MDDTQGIARRKHTAGLVLRLLLGVVFVLSAAAKLWSIDQFELYVFSYGFFSLNLTFILVRLCIGAELALGVLMLAGWLRHNVLKATLALLFFFSLFLCYAALIGRDDSCQCFGQMADMPPAVSLLKNAILIALTLLCIKLSRKKETRRSHIWLAIAATAACMTVPFVVSVPDNWMFGSAEERYNKEVFDEVMNRELAPQQPREGQKIIAFVTPGCPYCRMARQKLDYIVKRNHLAEEDVIYVEPIDIGTDTFLKITYGARPLILLTDNGEVAMTFHYRNINEKKIAQALNHQ